MHRCGQRALALRADGHWASFRSCRAASHCCGGPVAATEAWNKRSRKIDHVYAEWAAAAKAGGTAAAVLTDEGAREVRDSIFVFADEPPGLYWRCSGRML